MAIKDLNRRLTTMDSSFLYFEKKESPMHIGSVHIFEGEVDFEGFVEMMDAKIQFIPRYQQIVKPDPFNFSHPTWEFDPNFDVRKHVFKLQIDAPGGEKELIELSNKLFTPMMDRDKPLWDIFWVYGLQDGKSAMVARVHHCMIDGISGIDIMKVILDISPEIKPLPPKKTIPEPAPKLDPTRQFFDSLLGGMEEGMNRWMEFQNGLLNLSGAFVKGDSREAMQNMGGQIPLMATPATSLPFNGQLSGEKSLAWASFPFAEVRAIRAALDGTVNDVALTVLSSAVSKYVKLHGQPTENRKARFMVPVSLRQTEQRNTLGNLVSILPVEIPLDIDDPVERFRYIHQTTAAMKEGKVSESVSLFSALMGILPAPVQALAGAFASMPMPAVNMVATNVPGPQIPLYTMGKRMLEYLPYVPTGFAVGCSCAILTYDQKMTIGLTADKQAMPDVEVLRDFLNEAYSEILEAANLKPSEAETNIKTKTKPVKIRKPNNAASAKNETKKAVKNKTSTRKTTVKKTAPTVNPKTAKKSIITTKRQPVKLKTTSVVKTSVNEKANMAASKASKLAVTKNDANARNDKKLIAKGGK